MFSVRPDDGNQKTSRVILIAENLGTENLEKQNVQELITNLHNWFWYISF